MFRRLNLQKMLFGAFLFMGLLTFLGALTAWIGIKNIVSREDTVIDHNLPSVIALWKIREGQLQIESSEWNLPSSRLSELQKKNELDRMDSAWQQIEAGIADHKKAEGDAVDDADFNRVLTALKNCKQQHDEYMRLYTAFHSLGIPKPTPTMLELQKEGKGNTPDFVRASHARDVMIQLRDAGDRSRTAMESARKPIEDELAFHQDQASKNDAAADRSTDLTEAWVGLGMILGPILGIAFGLYFIFRIAKPLNDNLRQSGIQVTSSATQIASAGHELEAMVAEQVASTNEVVATAKEIAATSSNLVSTMDEVASMAEATTVAAGEGQKDLVLMEATMRQLTDATGSIAAKLGAISERTNNINSVVTTITKVADQTNLLSLNAAIEAEKAGEYGMGFAVVAREIRRLADQTAVATLDIEQMVKTMQSAVSTGVMEMDKFTREVSGSAEDVANISGQLSRVIDQVQALTSRFELVNQGMDAQAQGAYQISEAMIQLSEGSLHTADSLRDTNYSVEQLNEAAAGLH
ncbi:MAG: methyl-accepting chemotaxis protein, partial [Armatimonadota bacterium]|nr:methyl-accepting chemotaxis protein [Armatimonadota bacterium]